MKNLNNIFASHNEAVVPLTVVWNGKKVHRQMGIKFLTNKIIVGYITCNKTITGRYTWNAARYDLPVFKSAKKFYPNGQAVRVTKTLLNEAIKKTILDWVEAQLAAQTDSDADTDVEVSQVAEA